MTTAKLLPAEVKALKALDAAPTKTLKLNELRKATGLTFRGLSITFGRLIDKNLAGHCPGGVALTFGGMRALAAQPPSDRV